MTTRHRLIHKVAEVIPDVPKNDVAKAVEIAFNYMSEMLKEDHRIEIRGFGSFNGGSRIVTPTTNLGTIVYHHKEVKTINYRMSQNLLKKLNVNLKVKS